MKDRHPARSIDDMKIPDEAWKPDFEIADRYQTFSTEIMRVALLGIAGFGFLISEIAMKQYDKFCDKVASLAWLEILAVSCLGLSLACALIHRFFSTSCLYYQVQIGRGLKRAENESKQWTETELENEKGFITKFRDEQRINSTKSHKILVTSAVLLAVGYVGIVIIFCFFLEAFALKTIVPALK